MLKEPAIIGFLPRYAGWTLIQKRVPRTAETCKSICRTQRLSPHCGDNRPERISSA